MNAFPLEEPLPGRPLYGCGEPLSCLPDWARDFGRAAPLELEIGPGRGSFALDHAALHPELNLLVIETRRSDCELIRKRAQARGLPTLLVLQGDAKLLLHRLFGPRSLSAVHVQFPDPWWKKRHHRRRLVDADLAALLRSLLVEGGAVDFRTDVPAYAREAVQTWEDSGFDNLDGPGALWAGEPEVLSTRERRYAQTGQQVFRARLVNPAPHAPAEAAPLAAAEEREGERRTGRDWTDTRRK